MAKVPPAGGQQNYTEKPVKVYAEQYLDGMDPLPVGAFRQATGGVWVQTTHGPRELVDTDWILTSEFTGQPTDVLTDAEFAERFGHGNVATGAT